jgi:ornithine cyclodeaminase
MNTDRRTLIVSDSDVVRLLPMSVCIDTMADALGTLARGDALLPLRTVIRLPGGRNAFATMPAILGSAIGAKIITVFPDNEGTPYESHIGVVLYFDAVHGRLLAILDASSITAIRTAAVSGLATRLLAREDAHDLAILGSGAQAMTHLEAMMAVRPIDRVRIFSRTLANAERLAAEGVGRFSAGFEVCLTAESAVRGADISCTVTSSRAPVLLGEWLSPGAHINAVGASLRTSRELDSAAVQRSLMYVDRRESAMAEAGDYLIPREEEAIGDDHIIGELGDVVIGRCVGRTSPDDITLFKSLGLAVEDVACAKVIHERAAVEGAGTWVSIGGIRH